MASLFFLKFIVENFNLISDIKTNRKYFQMKILLNDATHVSFRFKISKIHIFTLCFKIPSFLFLSFLVLFFLAIVAWLALDKFDRI